MKKYRKLKANVLLQRVMKNDYLKSKIMCRLAPTAWITSGAPVEILRAMGINTFYPENYGALCAARRASGELCQEAEDHGFSRELCAYGRNHMGSIYNPAKAPLRGLPRPDLLVACNNICGTVLKWYQALSRHLQIPLFFLDTPYSTTGEVRPAAIIYVEKQLHVLVDFLETQTGKKLKEHRLLEVMDLSRQATNLWMEVRETGKRRPSPLNAPDLFVNMAPIVVLRGTKQAVDYYRVLLAELSERVALGEGAVVQEDYRLLWDNIAIWHRVMPFYNMFTQQNACFVVDTYTGAWSGELDMAADPYKTMALVYSKVLLNQGLLPRAESMLKDIREYGVDGFVMHANRSCKPYSQLQFELRRLVTEKTGLPGLIIEADMCDPRNYAEESIKTRVEAFLENLA